MSFEIRVAAWVIAYSRKGWIASIYTWETREAYAVSIGSYARAEACRRMILDIMGKTVRA